MGKATEDTSVQLGGWVEGFGSERVNMKLTAPSPIDKVGENTVQLHSPFTIEFMRCWFL